MWITSMGNHGAAGVISERRRSSCSSWHLDFERKLSTISVSLPSLSAGNLVSITELSKTIPKYSKARARPNVLGRDYGRFSFVKIDSRLCMTWWGEPWGWMMLRKSFRKCRVNFSPYWFWAIQAMALDNLSKYFRTGTTTKNQPCIEVILFLPFDAM